MIRRMFTVFLALLAVLCLSSPVPAEETQMEEIIIPGPNGDIYGVLQMPETDGPVPLVILSHGFGGNHTFNADYCAYFNSQGFATYNYDFHY